MKPRHTDPEYEQELGTLRHQIIQMTRTVEEMIEASSRALLERQSTLARAVTLRDHEVNRLEVEIDGLCLRMLARRQPVASDLRFITTALKVVTDLERIGDLCVNVSERAIELNQEPPLPELEDLGRMAAIARTMVRNALEAFTSGDVEKARRVVEEDKKVDVFYAQVFRRLLSFMVEDTATIHRATRLLAVAKNIERVGDHATNLAEMVVFMVEGRDIRHAGSQEGPRPRAFPHGILFLCVHNSARSQMAEGWARKLLPYPVRVWSAGSLPAPSVHPLAVRVMQEVGIDLTGHRPKRISDVPIGDVDTIITLCAEEICVPSSETMHCEIWAMPDPAAVAGGEEDILQAFRYVRDRIGSKIKALLSQAVESST